MIRMFRNIRDRLLQQGNIRKYALYATGEILLIVAGILIALQVNNWNEERMQQEVKNSYLNALLLELNDDHGIYNRTENTINRMEEAGRYVLPYFKDVDKVIEDSLTFFTEFHMTYIDHASFPDPVVWEELQNSGNLNLFQTEDILTDLYDYYSYLETMKSSYAINASKFINQGRYFDSSFFSREIQDDFVSDLTTTVYPEAEVMQSLREKQEPLHNINGMISGFMITRIQLEGIKQINVRLREEIKTLID